MVPRGALPKVWFEDIADPDARDLFEQYFGGLAELPSEVLQRLQGVMDDPAADDLDMLRVLALHQLEHGGDATTFIALTKLISAEVEKAGRGPQLEALIRALSDESRSN